MSIIIGLACKDAIVVASDSRMTDQASIRDDAKKIHLLKTKNSGLIISSAGCADSAEVIVSDMQKRVAGPEMVSDDSAARLMSDAIMDYKRNLAERRFCCRKEKVNENLLKSGLKCDVLLAYYFGTEAFIYTADLYTGIPARKNYPFWTLGVGDGVANYLLKQFDISGTTAQQAVFTAIAVISEVKESVGGCGGPTQLAIVSPTSGPELLTAQSVQEKECLVSPLRRQIKAHNDAIKDVVEKSSMVYQDISWTPQEDSDFR